MSRIGTFFAFCLCITAICLPVHASDALPTPVTRTTNSIHVSVDPRLELISIVQYLSDVRNPVAPLIVGDKDNFAYRRDVDAYFASKKSHPAVLKMSEMLMSGCSFSWPPTSMLFLDESLNRRTDLVANPMLLQRCGGEAKLEQLAEALRASVKTLAFASSSNNTAHITRRASIASRPLNLSVTTSPSWRSSTA
jgi:hypothetical protein